MDKTALVCKLNGIGNFQQQSQLVLWGQFYLSLADGALQVSLRQVRHHEVVKAIVLCGGLQDADDVLVMKGLHVPGAPIKPLQHTRLITGLTVQDLDGDQGVRP